MPFLKPEPCIWPDNLLDETLDVPSGDVSTVSTSLDISCEAAGTNSDTALVMASQITKENFELRGGDADSNASKWWAIYTKPRFEKKFMRQLLECKVPFYGPMISRRFRSPNGKLRLSLEPLFPNYVFIHGTEMQRYTAVCTGSVSRWMPVINPHELVTDLRQIHNLILTDAPLAPELRLQPGQKVRVRSGVFKGFEGVIIRRENQVRLLIAVRYMGRGASVALDDCQLEPI